MFMTFTEKEIMKKIFKYNREIEKGIKSIEDNGKSLGISQNSINTAKNIFKDRTLYGILSIEYYDKDQCVKTKVGGSILFAVNKNGDDVSKKDITEIVDLSYESLAKGYKIIEKIDNFELK